MTDDSQSVANLVAGASNIHFTNTYLLRHGTVDL